MKVDELWIIQYEGDDSFSARLNTSYGELSIGKELTVAAAERIYTSVGIHCGRINQLVPHEGKVVKHYLKIPFYK